MNTRRQLLDAAQAVFLDEGYAKASVADIVARSRLSVGSLYHHFDGKADLFVELWREFEARYSAAAGSAVADARRRGVSDPVDLFVAGARAYLVTAQSDGAKVALFRRGEGPPGFDELQRELGDTWIRNNAILLRLGDEPEDQLLGLILTSIVGDGQRVVNRLGERDPTRIIERTLSLVRAAAEEGLSWSGRRERSRGAVDGSVQIGTDRNDP